MTSGLYKGVEFPVIWFSTEGIPTPEDFMSEQKMTGAVAEHFILKLKNVMPSRVDVERKNFNLMPDLLQRSGCSLYLRRI